jgi:CheY-like chemotaxis protein
MPGREDMRGRPYEAKPGDYVLLTVRDAGSGMGKETMERIFDPFFTTKGLANGTGLGLTSVYGIIKAHSGYIDVESKKGHARPPRLSPAERDDGGQARPPRLSARDGGQGTTFSIYLPASERKLIRESKRTREVLMGTGTVLLIDDENMILDVGEQILKTLGYEVLLAEGGKEAIDIYKANKDKIDMVILDMIMPGMGGGEAYGRMKEFNPNVKVLLSSGYSIDGKATEILERGCDDFIQKPFQISQLSQKIKETLAKR